MATLLLTALGTAVGGPIGGAIGGLLGREVDNQLFGTTRQGPRLRELAVSTSSYGQPVARVFGQMRVPGSIIWASDIAEQARREGGRKGQPSVNSYSYTASFAVAISSRPIARLGRIWADGSLLRGAEGDLKVGGALRLYHGHGDDPVDPLIAAAAGSAAPAFRDYAYVVFENLDLGDFGNRVPALSFEVFAAGDEQSVSLAALLPHSLPAVREQALSPLHGLADEGGPLAATLAAIDEVMPLICTAGEHGLSQGLTLLRRPANPATARLLPERLPQANDEPGEGRYRQRAASSLRAPAAIRYYEEERDYQPGLQRALGLHHSGRERVVDLPAAMTAAGAKQLANEGAVRARWKHETIAWRIAELDPLFMPGALVRVPGAAGVWLVRGWEWFDRGIELELERIPPLVLAAWATDPGPALTAADRRIPPTILHLIEGPADGAATASLFAAASAASSAWRGAALHLVAGDALVPVAEAASDRAVIGVLAVPLGPSLALVFEPEATLEVALAAEDLTLENADLRALAMGANRLMIGPELVQFACAEPLDSGARWRLRGLLRGRAGTEPAAADGHAAQTPVILLDGRLTPLDPAVVPPLASTQIAALGLGDPEAVIAPLQNAGLSRRPLAPVHPRLQLLADGAWQASWTRRARGQWRWEDYVDTPLIEEREAYLIGLGALDAPVATWTVERPQLVLAAPERAALFAAHGPASLWVRQIGTFAPSQALLLGPLAP